ncbi:hypothetical protein QNA23_07405 [Rhodococcus erythropolis]|uniref:hypothetical protein n=1 Tax=Rhodococcus erythropolis TaxID=1833 RepID=UPI0024BAE314|nr:hypothetical protein [Rhodococcus erythropolis]MDJ0403297.1 hypothetical protein [Rhodococcus erythropolis]
MKVVRRKPVHEAVLDNIDREYLSINTAKLRAKLQTTREHIHGNTLHKCLDQWKRIIADNDIDIVRKISVSDTETDREMRNMSPLSVLLSESERLRVLDLLFQRTRE